MLCSSFLVEGHINTLWPWRGYGMETYKIKFIINIIIGLRRNKDNRLISHYLYCIITYHLITYTIKSFFISFNMSCSIYSVFIQFLNGKVKYGDMLEHCTAMYGLYTSHYIKNYNIPTFFTIFMTDYFYVEKIDAKHI